MTIEIYFPRSWSQGQCIDWLNARLSYDSSWIWPPLIGLDYRRRGP
jgi:hypothetical protein